jgi:hypothetical protein
VEFALWPLIKRIKDPNNLIGGEEKFVNIIEK